MPYTCRECERLFHTAEEEEIPEGALVCEPCAGETVPGWSASPRVVCEDCCSDTHYACCECDRHVRGHRFCTNCDRCVTCGCRCDEDEDDCSLSRYHVDSTGDPWRADRRRQRQEFSSSRLAGVEWEFNNAGDPDYLDCWRREWRAAWHSDGSCGEELVTAPLAGDYIRQCLLQCGAALSDADAEVNASCGVHVHVDAGDFSWHDLYRLLRVYALVEPALYLLGGQHRTRSQWCMPLGRSAKMALAAQDPKGAVLDLVYGHLDGRRRARSNPGKKDGIRYRGINLNPWMAARRQRAKSTKGKVGKPRYNDCTVEFRIHQRARPQDAQRIVDWTQLLVRLVDWAARASETDVNALPTDAMRALMVIAPDKADYIVQRARLWRKHVPRRARHIAYARSTKTWNIL